MFIINIVCKIFMGLLYYTVLEFGKCPWTTNYGYSRIETAWSFLHSSTWQYRTHG